MSTLKIAIAIIVIFSFSGCAINRPFPQQDDVTNEILRKLVSMQSLKKTPIFVKQVAYHYDTTNILRVQEKILQQEDRRVTSKDVPQLFNPTEKELRQASRIIAALKKRLDENGFKRIETSCKECLTAVVDYGQRHIDGEKAFFLFQRPGKTLFFPRVRLYYLGKEVAATRNDMGGWWEDTMAEPSDRIIAKAAEVLADEMEQVWELRIATWRQQLGAKK